MLLNGKSKKLAFAALLAALAIVFLYIPCLIPTIKLSMSAIAGLAVAAAFVELGACEAALCWAVASVLALLILPQKTSALLFAVFFGWYPILKAVSERMGRRVFEWMLKLAGFNIAAVLLWLFGRSVVEGLFAGFGVGIALLWLAANAAFVLYDFCMTWLIGFYMRSISPKLKR